MKATLKFNLPKEQNKFTLTIKGKDYYCALWDLNNEIRDRVKHGDEEISNKYEEFQELFNQILEDNNVNIYEININILSSK